MATITPAPDKTRLEWRIEGLYRDGWEEVTAEETRAAAQEQLRTYRENERGTAFRMRSAYVVLPQYEDELRATLDRINTHMGNGDITDIDMARGVARIERQYGGGYYKFTLMSDNRVRFRKQVRHIGYTPQWAKGE